MPHWITQCYLPPGRGGILALTPAEAGTRLSDPGGMQGWIDLQRAYNETALRLKYRHVLVVKRFTVTNISGNFAHKMAAKTSRHRYTHTHLTPFSGTTRVSRYQKGKTNLDFTEARYSEWQWHQLGHMQVCTSLQTLSFSTGRMPFLPPNQQRQSTEGLDNMERNSLLK